MSNKKSLGAKVMLYPTPVLVVCTYDEAGKPNAMTAAWGGICCSEPPCIAVSLRKATASYHNILKRRAFTINIPSEKYAAEADYFGIVSGRDADKFKVAGLTAVKADKVDAPAIAEFPLSIELKLIDSIVIGLHTQFIGQVMDIKADESVLGASGLPDMQKLRPIAFAPTVRQYYGLGEMIGSAFEIGKGVIDPSKKGSKLKIL